MDLSEPSAAVSPSLDGPILMVLAKTTRPLAAREIARLVPRGSWGGVRKVLLRLNEHGLVNVQEAGNATLYTLNREHLAAPAVEILARLSEELVRRLIDELASWNTPAAHASMFGSAARGDGDTTSDIDLFIVRPRTTDPQDPTWRSQLDDLANHVLAWTGNHASISEVSQTELGRISKTSAGRNIRAEGITLTGKPADKLLRRTR